MLVDLRSRSGVGMADRGSTSLTTVLLTPVFVVVALAAFQAALWSHARTEARVVARDTAALVARGGVAAADAQSSAAAVLAADADLRDVSVVVVTADRLVTVTVAGQAPGILRGSWSEVSVSAAIPLEGPTP